MPEATLTTRTAPRQRLADLESCAWQTERRLERVEDTLGEMNSKLSQHGIALSDTMRDLRDLRIDVHGIARTLGSHTQTLDGHTKTLDNHTKTLGSHTQTLDSHTKTLDNHTQTLATHTAILMAIATRLEVPLSEIRPGTDPGPELAPALAGVAAAAGRG